MHTQNTLQFISGTGKRLEIHFLADLYFWQSRLKMVAAVVLVALSAVVSS